jgi:aminopeptidase N
MEYYVLDYNRWRADKHLELLERSAKLLEKYFGEYPWVKEKIAIAETPHLGMEHQTMNAYGNQYKYVKMGEVDFDWLLTHEFGHEWWGNKVSNVDWAHMWIHEGICSFADALFYEDYGGRRAYLNRMKESSTKFSNQLAIVQGDVIDSRQTYHGDIYTKGAYFMHTLRYVIGDDVFFPAIKSFAKDPRFTYDRMVTTEDVLLHFNSAARRDLRPLFRLFLYTTDKLQVSLRQTGLETYEIKLLNLDMDVPMEITTSAGTQKFNVGKNPVKLRSTTMPVIDPDGFYLKKITIE